jgi:hypothetical protein
MVKLSRKLVVATVIFTLGFALMETNQAQATKIRYSLELENTLAYGDVFSGFFSYDDSQDPSEIPFNAEGIFEVTELEINGLENFVSLPPIDGRIFWEDENQFFPGKSVGPFQARSGLNGGWDLSISSFFSVPSYRRINIGQGFGPVDRDLVSGTWFLDEDLKILKEGTWIAKRVIVSEPFMSLPSIVASLAILVLGFLRKKSSVAD